MNGDDRDQARLGLPQAPGDLLGFAALLVAVSLALWFVPWGLLGSAGLIAAQLALLVRALRTGSRWWPLHGLLVVLTALPVVFIVRLALSSGLAGID